MIKANELRIGNIIWESNSFTPLPEDYDEVRVASINDVDKVIRDDKENGYGYDSLYGIRLTPEWLERLGFKKSTNIFASGVFELAILDHEVHYDASVYTYTYYGKQLRDIQYVHQLQNLYFVLTGTELEIKST